MMVDVLMYDVGCEDFLVLSYGTICIYWMCKTKSWTFIKWPDEFCDSPASIIMVSPGFKCFNILFFASSHNPFPGHWAVITEENPVLGCQWKTKK